MRLFKTLNAIFDSLPRNEEKTFLSVAEAYENGMGNKRKIEQISVLYQHGKLNSLSLFQ